MSEYIRDGHRLHVKVAGGAIEGGLECPGAAKCKAWHDGECHLLLFFGDVGFYEFAEWQNDPYRESTLPCEIEHCLEGWGHESELWWRPVVTETRSWEVRACPKHGIFPGTALTCPWCVGDRCQMSDPFTIHAAPSWLQ
jgi:hypothetical protein